MLVDICSTFSLCWSSSYLFSFFSLSLQDMSIFVFLSHFVPIEPIIYFYSYRVCVYVLLHLIYLLPSYKSLSWWLSSFPATLFCLPRQKNIFFHLAFSAQCGELSGVAKLSFDHLSVQISSFKRKIC